mgnify:FL=1
MEQIRLGLKYNLDVSIYAKSEFADLQMEEIRKGLERNLDVSVYAKKELHFSQMREIREKLLKDKLGSSYSPFLL